MEARNDIANFPISGTNKVEKVKYDAVDKKIYINDTQYFGNVNEKCFRFFIGGYQPAQKWLKDRKERILDFDEIRHYQKIIWVLSETESLMGEVDKV